FGFHTVENTERALVSEVPAIGQDQPAVPETRAKSAEEVGGPVAVDVAAIDGAIVGDAIRVGIGAALSPRFSDVVVQDIELQAIEDGQIGVEMVLEVIHQA